MELRMTLLLGTATSDPRQRYHHKHASKRAPRRRQSLSSVIQDAQQAALQAKPVQEKQPTVATDAHTTHRCSEVEAKSTDEEQRGLSHWHRKIIQVRMRSQELDELQAREEQPSEQSTSSSSVTALMRLLAADEP
jgi:hypothetical protein